MAHRMIAALTAATRVGIVLTIVDGINAPAGKRSVISPTVLAEKSRATNWQRWALLAVRNEME